MMKTYERYKPSGVDWLGDIPEHWEAKKLKFVSDVILGKMLTNEDKGDYLLKPYLRAANLQWMNVDVSSIKEMWFSPAEVEKLRIEEGDLLVSEGGEVGRTCIWRNELDECYIQNSVHKISFFDDYNSKFFLYQFYVLGSIGFFESIVNRISIAHLTGEKIKETRIWFPPFPEQTAIANYLDEKTAQLDKLIENKRRLIALLKDERSGIINNAVTRGINPHAKLKPSGINWLGEIPEHWEVRKLKYVAEMQGGFAFNSSDYVTEGIQLIKIGNLYQNNFLLERQPTFLPETYLEEYNEWVVENGDILISMTGTLGKRDYGYAIQNEEIDRRFLLNQRVSRIRFNENELQKEFALHILRSNYYLDQLFLLPTGTKQGNLSNEQVLSIPVIFPKELSEQKQIIQFIQAETGKIDATIAKIEKEIEYLLEYRTALISEVVTGKIKVV